MWPNCVEAERLIYDPLCGSGFILYPKHVAILWVSVLKGYTFQYRNVKGLGVTVNPYGGQGHVCND